MKGRLTVGILRLDRHLYIYKEDIYVQQEKLRLQHDLFLKDDNGET